ncbi:MAG TPA: hypothetical protein VKM54_09840 [Myxococcota bacterium]|nr:hypothetical protein [Myxococcota bacterium]
MPDFPAVPVDEYLPTIISLEEQDRVIARIPGERRGAFLAARLGLRPSEVHALNMEDYREGCLIVAHGMKGPASYHPRRGTKSRRFRFVEVDRELADWITEYQRAALGAPLFVAGECTTAGVKPCGAIPRDSRAHVRRHKAQQRECGRAAWSAARGDSAGARTCGRAEHGALRATRPDGPCHGAPA